MRRMSLTLTLTCDCGARFEVDDTFAGRDVPCPDCGATLRAPSKGLTRARPSWLGLLAVVLVTVGAFTLVGTLAGAGVAAVALVLARRDPTASRALPLGALIAGLVLTLFTLFAVTWPDRLPVAAWLRQHLQAGQIDTTGPEVVQSRNSITTLERPKGRTWGQVVRNRTSDPAVGDLQKDCELLLIRLSDRAYIDERRVASQGKGRLDELFDVVTADISTPRPPLLGGEDDVGWDRRERPAHVPVFPVRERRIEDPPDFMTGREWIVDTKRGGQTWRFLIRAYRRRDSKNPNEPVLVLRAYAPRHRFETLESELRAILDTARFTP